MTFDLRILLLMSAALLVVAPAWGAKFTKSTLVGLNQGFLLEEIRLDDPSLISNAATGFQIGPKGVPLFSVKNEIHLIIGKKKKYKSDQDISSFGFSPRGALFIVSGRQLGTIENGKFLGKINLPFDNMRVLPKNDISIIIFGNDPQSHGQIFLLNSDGTFSKQMQTTAPLQDVKVLSDGLLVLTDTSIYRYQDGNSPSALLTLFRGKLESAEIGPGLRPEDVPFFVSTDDGVFLSKQGRLVPLLGNVHCQLAGYISADAKLSTYALCPEKKKLFKLTVEIAKLPTQFHPAKEIPSTETGKIKRKEAKKWKE